MTYVQAGPSGSSRKMPGSGVGWDDQIVPALRRRLESESAYISDRMSGASFPDFEQPSLLPRSAAGQDTTTITTTTRTRTKSSMNPAAASRIPSASTRSPEAPTTSNGAMSRNISTNPNTTVVRPSRIPMRPRSKSNLAARPSPADISPPDCEVPALPDSTRGGRPTMYTRQSSMSRSYTTRGRGSPDFANIPTDEGGFLKNELPPFRLRSDEAMRIAQRGHDLDDGGSDEEDRLLQEAAQPRKRRETMRVSDGSGEKRGSKIRPNTGVTTVIDKSSSSGMTRSATGDVGLGLPASRTNQYSNNAQAPRSSSSRQPKYTNLGQSTNTTNSSSTPRSASLNMLSSNLGHSPSSNNSARLGVAAHFVPPESTYTPPKGQNWDEVVLPTVAKKLGLNDSTSGSSRNGIGSESDGDLAVEWDKTGTPIKWIKKESVSRVGGAGEASKMLKNNAGLTGDDFITRDSTPSPWLTPTKSSSHFSPTFEPSPDNPLASHHQPQTHLHPNIKHRPSQNSLGTPIRTPSGHHTPLSNRASPPPSPAPFSQMQPNPGSQRNGSYGPRPQHSHSSLGRKPSTYRKQAPNTPSKVGGSGEEYRMGQRGGQGDQYFSNPRPAPGPSGPGGVYDGRPNEQGSYRGQSQAQGAQSVPGQVGGKNKDDHGKGCGCLIM